MIDININAILSQALAAAVQQATAPLLKRIAALEYQSANRHERLRVLEGALTDRVAALENNPAQGVDTTLEETLERLDNQEWFWNKIRNFTDTAVEQAIEEHNEHWDHDDFVTEDKLDDYVQKDSFRDEIEDVLNNATIKLRF